MKNYNKEQLLLLVDRQDNFKGKFAKREDCHRGKGLHHRAFVVVLYNDQNEILIQKRKHALFDNFWDISATSHVIHLNGHTETYQEAMERCLQTELGIVAFPLERMEGFNYTAIDDKYSENEYCAIFVGKYTGDVTPNLDVLYEYTYKSFPDILGETKESPHLYTPWAILTFALLQKKGFLK